MDRRTRLVARLNQWLGDVIYRLAASNARKRQRLREARDGQ